MATRTIRMTPTIEEIETMESRNLQWMQLAVTTLVLAVGGAVVMYPAETVLAGECCESIFASCLCGTCLEACPHEEEGCSYGPCACQPRGTLLQWSYGTSFSGGPDLDEPLVTDRPDFTEASSTVGLGVAQLEMGYTYLFDDDGTTTTKTHSYPETLLRYGILADWLELRVFWNYVEEEFDGINASGSDDLFLGFKIGLTPQEGILPEMALIPQMTVPSGADVFTADEALPGVNWIYGWEINDFLSTAGSTQFNRTIDDGTQQAYTEWAQSWTIAYGLSDKLGAYTEWFALFPHSADTSRPQHFFNGGFTYLINNDVQWDIRAGTALNEAADDYFVGTGLSIRFP